MKIHHVEQRSPEWYALRTGMPTASEFSRIITSTGERSKSFLGYAKTLAADLYVGRPVDSFEGNGWTDRGREQEAHALELYRFAHGEVEPIGLVTTDDGSAGCSPDGLVGADGMVEVKCLKAENHISAILYYRDKGRCPTDYVQQTQGQLLICERKWCDLVFYHPDLPELVIRQEPDPKIFEALKREIPALLQERDSILAALHNHAEAA